MRSALFLIVLLLCVPGIAAMTITLVQPTGTVESHTVLMSLATSENATCRYALTSKDYNYTRMTAITGSLSTVHNVTLSDVANGSTWYDVACRNATGAISTDSFDIKVDIPLVNETYYAGGAGTGTGAESVNGSSPRYITTTAILSSPAVGSVVALSNPDFVISKLVVTPLQGGPITFTFTKYPDAATLPPFTELLYQAYDIATSLPATFSVQFTVARAWLEQKHLSSGAVSVYVTDNGTWLHRTPQLAASAQDRFTYVVSGIAPGYFLIGVDRSAVLAGQLSSLSVNSSATTTTSATTTSTTAKKPLPPTLDGQPPSGRVAQVDQSLITAQPADLGPPAILWYLLAAGLLSLIGLGIYGMQWWNGRQKGKDQAASVPAQETLPDALDSDALIREAKVAGKDHAKSPVLEQPKEEERPRKEERRPASHDPLSAAISGYQEKIDQLLAATRPATPMKRVPSPAETEARQERIATMFAEASRAKGRPDALIRRTLANRGYPEVVIDRALKATQRQERAEQVYEDMLFSTCLAMQRGGADTDAIRQVLRSHRTDEETIQRLINKLAANGHE